ncbi:sarcosine oxidase subunit gamma [Thalassobius sp. Cn5-15]|uniref:sarcosine oxidase subunit gamma n=1 Tax=Thalassobius sp. Cn5-15 TaxID=2917763 RepID=UPI001EF179A5|nr:sarcosine oxidase subunit gamma family protein [Thalassobius sp. Cn5-15]MCG7492548.1 sarcosine oxidase subunit gamma family protein [Thalassobius sp. Cn5-15]
MSEALLQTALNGASSNGFVRVEELGVQGMITLRGDFNSAGFAAGVEKVTGLALPALRKVVAGDQATVAWMSPDELLVLVDYATVDATVAALNEALAEEHALVANVSDARAFFRLSGDDGAVRDVMAKVAPVDLSPAAFGQGDIRRSRLAQVAGAFWSPEPGVMQVICFRSVAQYAFDLLRISSESGGEVGHLG